MLITTTRIQTTRRVKWGYRDRKKNINKRAFGYSETKRTLIVEKNNQNAVIKTVE